jgi:predicted transcriptional regulator
MYSPSRYEPRNERSSSPANEEASVDGIIEITADIVSAYLARNDLAPHDLPFLIKEVYAALNGLGQQLEPKPEPVKELKPAVPIKKSVTSDERFLICLEDGRQFRSLKRHLREKYNMSPDDYRKKWGLPSDYPMVAPAYARERSKLARETGLGQLRRSNREEYDV